MAKYITALAVVAVLASAPLWGKDKAAAEGESKVKKVTKTDAEWKKQLSEMQYYVLRKHGTERSFTGKYWDEKRKGTYHCSGCGLALFDAATKYKSGTGWPSFWQPIKKENIGESKDKKLFYTRVEVHCAACGGHLGHVFEDGPDPTGLRYCINSVSLIHSEDKKAKTEKKK
jgi:peptide-methionine (R)-S-oxide reductase